MNMDRPPQRRILVALLQRLRRLGATLPRHTGAALALLVLLAGLGLTAAQALASDEDEDEPLPLESLKRVPVPGPDDRTLAVYVRDHKALLQLGKALFWDQRVGSDNRVACASCHFQAGADSRSRNQLNPGLLGGDRTFQLGGPNYTLKPGDFPFTRFANVDDPASRHADVNEIVSSHGVFTQTFSALGPNGSPDRCDDRSDAVFHGGSGFQLGGVNTRRVEPRNAPSVINAIFNLRNFWDGRAGSIVNGVDLFGNRNPEATIWKYDGRHLHPVRIAVPLSSLTALASGPPLSADEMSCAGRRFALLGRKLADVVPLSLQTIAPTDSVLGPLARSNRTYGDLIRAAFHSTWWSARSPLPADSGGYASGASMDLTSQHDRGRRPPPERGQTISQYEANFALFFGLAVQSYLRTLVSDDSPFDRHAEGQRDALTARQRRGLAIFTGPVANCIHCHDGGVITSAAVNSIRNEGRLDSRAGANGTMFRYDHGFFNTGARPTREDLGIGGLDPFGLPLSDTRLSQLGKTGLLGPDFDQRVEEPVAPDALTAVDGAFKVPSLRNVALTGPYFHNGGKATLMQVIDLYNRGGDFGIENAPLVDPTVRPLGLSEPDKVALVDFLLALTDDRVRFKRAPFDHPSLCVVDGHVGDARAVERVPGTLRARDRLLCLPAVGAAGLRQPLQPFLGLSPFAH